MSATFHQGFRTLPTLRMLAAWLAACGAAHAAQVDFAVSPRETAVGEPVTMRITVKDGSDIGEPTLAGSADVRFELLPRRQSMSSMQLVNGVLRSESTTTLTVLVTPLAQGIVPIPPVSIMVDGIEHRSPAIPISVGKSDADTLLQVVVTSDGQRTYVGQPLDLILRIAVRPYRSREHDIVLPEADMWGLIDGDRSEWGIFAKTMRELAQRGQRPAGREELLDGAAWYVYEIQCRTWPTRPGVPDIGDVRIQWRYPTGLIAQRGIFGGRELALSGTRLISAKASAEGIDVLALPAEGRPDGFAGAVGDFSIRAEARPTKAAVGDPITLTVQITDRSGEADMDSLPPPPLGPGSLGPDFRIPEAPLAGTVSGQSKTFTQTIRPTREGLEAIPPVTFSWFDPQARAYRSASTEPIAISVAPSERISTDAILGGISGAAASSAARSRALTPTAGGVPASLAVTPSLVADRRATVPGALAVSLLVAPPLACAAAAIALRRKRISDADPNRVRERSALREALAAVRNAAPSDAIAAYACARLHRPSGTLTARELHAALADAGADESLSKAVSALVEDAERSRFAPAGASGSADGRAEAQRVLTALDRLDWQRARRARSGGGR